MPQENMHQKANRLVNEKSPYLLQHAYNPVDWYPWGDEAFQKARDEAKPVFLSIGYSTCHWCHVMERESFEDEEVAALLNEGFVAVKVDREERPDLDLVYMNVCQALTGSGGWPLTVFLTPDRKPFFAGTYFPKRARYGRPGLVEILKAIRAKWESDREGLEGAGQEIMEGIARYIGASAPGDPEEELLHSCFHYLKGVFDPVYGGFGGAPKFPTPHNILFLFRCWERSGEVLALEMAEKTLQGIYCGGIYDHLGFGFSRYSTDREWLVPHFEKMLYDNALLAYVYLEAYQVTKKRFYAGVAREIFAYVLGMMTSPEGGFYSAEDADSEGEEGKFYLWTPEQVEGVLGEDDGKYFCRLYGITPGGNFEGLSIPNLVKRRESLFEGEDGPVREERAEVLRRKLFSAREQRVHPFKDDKVLTSWNGLMIAALARGAWVLGDEVYRRAAERAARFLLDRLRDQEGRLLARYRQGEAAYRAYLDDYAFLIWGLSELYQATFKPEYLEQALSLTGEMQELFWDQAAGGFFFTARDSVELAARPKEIYDGAVPSGNSVAAWNLLRLARLTGDGGLEESAHRQLHAFGGAVARAPQGSTFYLCALDFALGPPQEIVIAGELDGCGTQELLELLRAAYLPRAAVLLRPGGVDGEALAALAQHSADKQPVDGKPAVYICENYACQEPLTSREKLEQRLIKASRRP